MNILDTVGISLPCHSCGNTYRVPLRDVLLSHTILHDGCPVAQETECPPAFQSRLFERKDIEELERAFSRLDQRARADGGELVLMAAGPSDERIGRLPQQSKKASVPKPARSKSRTRKNRKVA
jgi:hypothetical protein